MKKLILALAFLCAPVLAQQTASDNTAEQLPAADVSTATLSALEEGLLAAEAEDFETAIAKWRPLAETCDADAQFNLGILHDNGLGVKQDYIAAVEWYRRAAESGHAKAQFNLGGAYDQGDGVERDAELAMKWWRAAATAGETVAQFNLANLLAAGGAQPQLAEARKWYQAAAERGHAGAQYNLAVMLEGGHGGGGWKRRLHWA